MCARRQVNRELFHSTEMSPNLAVNPDLGHRRLHAEGE